jgi:TRPM family ion channel
LFAGVTRTERARVVHAFGVDFCGGTVARAVEVESTAELATAASALGLTPRPTLVLIGGADSVDEAEARRLRPLFVEVVCPLIAELDGQVVDGATDVGVMRLMGRARAAAGRAFPLVGVAAAANVCVPGRQASRGARELERNHSHFLLVPGSGWGSESLWLSELATVLADECGEASATLLVGGGDVSWMDAERSVAASRSVVAVSGTGGAADAAIAALGEGGEAEPRARRLAASGLLVAADPAASADSVTRLLRRLLTQG